MANYYDHSYANAFDHKQYGAMSAPSVKKLHAFRPSRLNVAAICLCLFVPWLLFCFMYAVMSFSIHYRLKQLTIAIVLLGLVFVVIVGQMAFAAVKRHRDDPDTDSRWFMVLAATVFIAWIAGVVLGDLNYFYNLEPFFAVSQLNSYPNVDPSTSGQQVMDAGRVSFVKGSRLDLNKSMVFRNLESYCVAPVVHPSNKTAGAPVYDFWAVGLNCCEGVHSGELAHFACGEYNNPRASSGLRVMREDQRAFYRLAVQQAEATYNIRAQHPLFFFWMQDPVSEIAAYLDEGFKYYLFGLMTFFAAMLLVITAAFFAFTKF